MLPRNSICTCFIFFLSVLILFPISPTKQSRAQPFVPSAELGEFMNDLGHLKDYQQWRAAKLHGKLLQDPNDLEALVHLARLWSFGNNFDRSFECIERALAIDPNHRWARMTYADLLKKSGRLDSVSEPNSVSSDLPPCTLGWTHLDARDAESAIKVAEGALASGLEPKACFYCIAGKALELLGNTFLAQGKDDEGIAFYEEARAMFELAIQAEDPSLKSSRDWRMYARKHATKLEQLRKRAKAQKVKKD